jgi:hypothetical protein
MIGSVFECVGGRVPREATPPRTVTRTANLLTNKSSSSISLEFNNTFRILANKDDFFLCKCLFRSLPTRVSPPQGCFRSV